MSYDITCNHTPCACRQASHAYDFMGCPKLIIYLPFMPAEQYLLKLTASRFNTLDMQYANQHMMERIHIAMQNKNEADCIENIRICSESIGSLYKQ